MQLNREVCRVCKSTRRQPSFSATTTMSSFCPRFLKPPPYRSKMYYHENETADSKTTNHMAQRARMHCRRFWIYCWQAHDALGARHGIRVHGQGNSDFLSYDTICCNTATNMYALMHVHACVRMHTHTRRNTDAHRYKSFPAVWIDADGSSGSAGTKRQSMNWLHFSEERLSKRNAATWDSVKQYFILEK